jgi:16S rRNA A1518/A1519 N6-dimethyltransferase RsmA/KsgA/DIM1 with predicted DNA glycosylase/AP lyase activity
LIYFFYVIFFLILVFGFVILFGAPFLPTLKKQVVPIFELLDLREGQTLIELGSGDGRILLEAGRRGINAIGYELNPILVLYSIIKTWKYRQKVRVIWGNYWHKDWPQADGIFVFLLDRYMLKLNNKIIQKYKAPIKLVSFAFKIPDRKIDRQNHGLFLYQYNQPRK